VASLSLEKLHHEERMALVLADVVQGTDVRMLEPGHRAGFALEALAPHRVGGQRRRQHLDRHRPVEPGVARLEDLAHAAFADQRQDLVRAETRTGRQHQCLGR
jgi:hypothetical protein